MKISRENSYKRVNTTKKRISSNRTNWNVILKVKSVPISRFSQLKGVQGYDARKGTFRHPIEVFLLIFEDISSLLNNCSEKTLDFGVDQYCWASLAMLEKVVCAASTNGKDFFYVFCMVC